MSRGCYEDATREKLFPWNLSFTERYSDKHSHGLATLKDCFHSSVLLLTVQMVRQSVGKHFQSATENSYLRIITNIICSVFTARRYAGAVYAIVVCQSVRPSVCHKRVLSQNG